MRGTAAAAPALLASVFLAACGVPDDARSPIDCLKLVQGGFRGIALERADRFLGKVQEETAGCRGGERAVRYRATPWVDWSNYWGTGDAASRGRSGTTEDRRGIEGALLDLEYQRLELIEFNLLDNGGTYAAYVKGSGALPGPALDAWSELRLAPSDPGYAAVGGAGEQLCRGELVRYRTLTGICNDPRNPAMGATGQKLGRLVEFEATFPELGQDELARNRHGDRLGLLRPDPQRISRTLLSRAQAHPERCRGGAGLAGDSPEADCDYQKADTLNVLAAFWIQFQTHDWFSHLEEGRNAKHLIATGCETAAADGCRRDDRIDAALVADDLPAERFDDRGRARLARAHRTSRNTVTAWWDASQLYGYDERSLGRVKRDPADLARLRLEPAPGDPRGYLPLLGDQDPQNPAWSGQEATAFADNWNVGLSFFHNVFAREHNAFVDAFRKAATRTPEADTGLRDPERPDAVVRYRDVTPRLLFEVARLVVAAEIAKIHTIEWTAQLLYDEPLYLGMNANWSGLFGAHPAAARVLAEVTSRFGGASELRHANQWYSVFAMGPGIVGLDRTNHFGSPFNFPEEFVTAYRLHALVPDLLEYRALGADANVVRKRIPLVDAFRGRATPRMREGGLAGWAVSLGRQRAGALTLENHPLFLQALPMPVSRTGSGLLDVAALDILRDRERGVPRYNELRRQLGLRQLTSFDDFVDQRLASDQPERQPQLERVIKLREVYGQHRCDLSKRISTAQLAADGTAVTDCLGQPDGTLVDNVEDLDAVVGFLAESTRPHGFAISETQLQVFILEASRRLFSDRFLTASFKPAFYSELGMLWVSDNGPDGKQWEAGTPNGHRQEVSPMKRVLLRALPELADELRPVVNVFDPWARDRGEYYSLAWRPRPGAEADPAFRR
jgi:Animal haem peroxidase